MFKPDWVQDALDSNLADEDASATAAPAWGIGTPSLTDAQRAHTTNDESGYLATLRTWQTWVRAHLERERVWGQVNRLSAASITTAQAPQRPFTSVLPSRGLGPAPTLDPAAHDLVLRRSSLGDTQFWVGKDGVVVLLNRAATIWTLDLHCDQWGSMLWGLPAPAAFQTQAVEVQGSYMVIQRSGTYFRLFQQPLTTILTNVPKKQRRSLHSGCTWLYTLRTIVLVERIGNLDA